MDWSKRLQKRYKEGTINQEKYEAELKALLDEGEIQQSDYDDALKYDPKTADKALYTEEDMKAMAYNVARRMLRQEAQKAGIDLKDVKNADLIAKLVELAKAGTEDGGSKGEDGKGEGKKGDNGADAAEVGKLKATLSTLQTKVKTLTLENVVLKNVGTYQPINPAQVVRSIEDYEDLIEYDENDVPTARSVKNALAKVAKTEPNLFKTPDGQEGAGNGDEGSQGSGFSGKPPGGAAGGGSGQSSKEAAEQARLQAEALERMGIKKAQ